MIIKTILTSIILFGVYSFVVSINPSMSETQHQWQDNVVRAEKYIYDDNTDTALNLIVGSSLAQRLKNDSLPNFYNLAFAGQSIFEGLEIINHKKKLPKNVFIETNLIFKEQDKVFTSSLFWPLTYTIKKYCAALRSDKQPLVFIYPSIKNTFDKNNGYKIEETSLQLTNTRKNKVFSSMLKLQIDKYSKIPDSTFVKSQFLLLTKLVTELKSKGVNILFFEMPLNPNLVELPLAKFIRESFYEYFPLEKNKYITIPGDCSNYVTTDGTHLTDGEALMYTSYFKQEVKKILQ